MGSNLTPRLRRLLADLWQEWKQLEGNIDPMSGMPKASVVMARL